jgi:hypothetical protein
MDWKLERLNNEVKSYWRDLYAIRTSSGMLQIYKRGVRWETFTFEGRTLHYSRPNPQFILALTDTWTLTGKPVDWGIEPTMSRIREMDSWRDDRIYEDLVKERERAKANKDRAYRNEIRARAYDLRKDFARATNDINTSALEKVDHRRRKDGYCKSGS